MCVLQSYKHNTCQDRKTDPIFTTAVNTNRIHTILLRQMCAITYCEPHSVNLHPTLGLSIWKTDACIDFYHNITLNAGSCYLFGVCTVQCYLLPAQCLVLKLIILPAAHIISSCCCLLLISYRHAAVLLPCTPLCLCMTSCSVTHTYR